MNRLSTTDRKILLGLRRLMMVESNKGDVKGKNRINKCTPLYFNGIGVDVEKWVGAGGVGGVGGHFNDDNP